MVATPRLLGLSRRTYTRGRTQHATTPTPISAMCHPKKSIEDWVIGAKMNCPRELPALMTPAAKPRFSTEIRRPTAPSNTEKLAAPAPVAAIKPRVKIRAGASLTVAVSAMPSA